MEIIKEPENNKDDYVFPEIEGDRWNYFYVCEECHGYLKWHQEYCENCRKKVNWNG